VRFFFCATCLPFPFLSPAILEDQRRELDEIDEKISLEQFLEHLEGA